MKAYWNKHLLAESNNTIVVENNHYFPADSLNMDFFEISDTTTICPWKGTASYYSIRTDDGVNKDAAWYYRDPKEAAINIKDRVAFWRGVKVVE